jgi:hypothetical protein
MLGDNGNPGLVDNASSVQRRVVVSRYHNKVTEKDAFEFTFKFTKCKNAAPGCSY